MVRLELDGGRFELLDDLPRRRTSVLPALLRVQRRFGYISSDAIEVIAKQLRLTPGDVDGIASGYPDLHRLPPAQTVVRICDGLSCALAGADELDVAIETQASATVEVSRVPCLFACAVAPVVKVGSRCIGRATAIAVSDAISRRESSS